MINKLLAELMQRGPALIATVGLVAEPDSDKVANVSHRSKITHLFDLDAVDPGQPLPIPSSGRVVIVARTYTDLRRATTLAALLPPGKLLTLAIVEPSRLYYPALPIVSQAWDSVRELTARQGPLGTWVIEAKFDKVTPSGRFLAAIVHGLDGEPLQKVLRVALAGPGAAHWRPGDAGAVLTTEAGPLDGPNGFLPADLVLRSVNATPAAWSDPRTKVVDRPQSEMISWAALGSAGAFGHKHALTSHLSQVDSVPPVDERSVNPMGFIANPTLGIATLLQRDAGWRVEGGGAESVAIHPSGAMTDADVAKLRQLRAIRISWGRHTGPIQAVRTIAGLAAAGVPLYAGEAPAWAGALGGELTALIMGVKSDDLEDNLRREEHSIRLRRSALRMHSTQARWRNIAAAEGLPVPGQPLISVLLCTRRPEYIASALAQIARQRHVDLEVVLILHGLSTRANEVIDATSAFERPLKMVEVPSDAVFGDALNRGVSKASGRYLAKWDDDDWYGPEFLADAMLAVNYSGADIVGCLHQFIFLEQINLTICRPGGESERLTRQISGNSLFMDRHIFDAVGGFPPISRNVDTGLLRAAEAVGGRIYRTHGMASMVHRRAAGHTWTPPITSFLRASTRQWRGFRPGVLNEIEANSYSLSALNRRSARNA